jgi:hypothetical protein
MPRERLTFRQRDVSAAIKAIRQAGLTVVEVKISPAGEIVLSTTQGDKPVPKRNRALDDLYENPINVR